MAYQRPAWADALKNILSGLANQQPKPLLPAVALFAGVDVTTKELADFVANAAENDPTLTQLRMAFAGWDADEAEGIFLDAEGNDTSPRTAGRRQMIYGALKLEGAATTAIAERVPVYEAPVIKIS